MQSVTVPTSAHSPAPPHEETNVMRPTSQPEKVSEVINQDNPGRFPIPISSKGKSKPIMSSKSSKEIEIARQAKHAARLVWAATCIAALDILMASKTGENYYIQSEKTKRGLHKVTIYTKYATTGIAYNREVAIGIASSKALKKYEKDHPTPKTKLDLTQFEFQSNDVIPQAPFLQTDASVVTDSGLFTNTSVPTPIRNMNSTAMALDNPMGTGAPFSKHAAVYNIFQRWDEKNVSINPSLREGTEILRISLDPQTLPQAIKSYVNLHDAIIPSIEVSLAIAGAAGSIGWLVLGWVPNADPAIKYTLADLQQISCETTNMNGTQIFNLILEDIRKNGLYRNTVNDPEPYPGFILMVDQPVTNVQRNDAVNYPVRVQVRLTQNCHLMRPNNSSGSVNPISLEFNLGSYFYNDTADLIVTGSTATNQLSDLIDNLADDGFTTGDFKPYMGAQNVIAMEYANGDHIPCFIKGDTPSAAEIANINNFNELTPTATTAPYGLPTKFITAHGDMMSLPKEYTDSPYLATKDIILPSGTVYDLSLNYKTAKGVTVDIISMIVQDRCAFLVHSVRSTNQNFKFNGKDYKVVFYPNSNAILKESPMTFIEIAATTNQDKSFDVFYWDKNHNDEIVGDPLPRTPGFANFPLQFAVWPSDLPVPKVYVQTGNTHPTTALPSGLKQIGFSRVGTTTKANSDTGVVLLNEPVIKNAFPALDRLLASNNIDMAKMDLVVAGENLGQLGYSDGTFVARTDTYNKLKASIPTDIILKNISAISSLQGLQTFDTSSFSSWAPSELRSRPKRIPLSHFKFESAPLMYGIGSGLAGLGSMMYQQQQQERELRNQRALVDANNMALAERQRLMFERNMQMTGVTSTSARAGIYSNVASTSRSFQPEAKPTSTPDPVPENYYSPATGMSVDTYKPPLAFSGPLNQGLGIDPKFQRMLNKQSVSRDPIAFQKSVKPTDSLITTEGVPQMPNTNSKVPDLHTITEHDTATKPSEPSRVAATSSLPPIPEDSDANDESNIPSEETPSFIPSQTFVRSDLRK
ncbi:hypothetical protein 2 [Hubei picorna-like virus 64]|uniref:hypothetical protein 2 n=1 Tax=Hubei picorna-like virus 64 TaxID=1923147 RepID=UPI00090BF95D|nr:hypothetical protein 2 [Hubei picorna-like virus 64]APG77454.1 hypothetical protein 2 [Hubei picorna-like virus 64]